jgi:hypothetical protein
MREGFCRTQESKDAAVNREPEFLRIASMLLLVFLRFRPEGMQAALVRQNGPPAAPSLGKDANLHNQKGIELRFVAARAEADAARRDSRA